MGNVALAVFSPSSPSCGFSFLPFSPPKKGKGPAWCCLPGCGRSPNHTAVLPQSSREQIWVAMLCTCGIEVFFTCGPQRILSIFVGFEWDSSHPAQIPASPPWGQGVALRRHSVHRGITLPTVSFRQPVPWQPSRPPILTCGTARFRALDVISCAGSSLSRLEKQFRK